MNTCTGDLSVRPVLVMAGGTGGHVFPALAVARELLKLGVSVVWMGTRSGLEARIVPEAGLPVEWINVSGLRGKGLPRIVLAPFMLAWALVQSMLIMLRVRPLAVLGMGGFVSGPGALTARLLRRPLLIHEQNSVPGLTNRMLAPLAGCVMEAFPGSLPAERHPVHTGNPVREEISSLPVPEARLRDHGGPLRLLVIGGSLGARALNRAVPVAIRLLPEGRRPQVRHQTGMQDLDEVRLAYRVAGAEAEVEPFISDMASAYGWADVVLCRAGALTVAELAAAGVASILVPYPHAVDDHQSFNARYLVQAGAAIVVPQTELSVTRLVELLAQMDDHRDRILEMARSARRLARPGAARQVAELCLEAAGLRNGPDAAGRTA
jgi:UDP-N-acetylglucosamine--N-acetylmuramyl-(pentapeptide) pyrophosphoryl-undecaprenol N-acetylglucosamine transferase